MESPACFLEHQRRPGLQRYDSILCGPGQPLSGLPSRLGEPVQLTDGQGRWHIHNGGWSPDGKEAVYTRDTDTGNIYVIDRAPESAEL